jgi:hypothetical protein
LYFCQCLPAPERGKRTEDGDWPSCVGKETWNGQKYNKKGGDEWGDSIWTIAIFMGFGVNLLKKRDVIHIV